MREEYVCTLGLTGEMLASWRDHLLNTRDMARLNAHIPTCAACQQYINQLINDERLLRGQREIEPGNRIWRNVQLQARQARQPRNFLVNLSAMWSGVASVAALIVFAVIVAQVTHGRPTAPVSSVLVATSTSTATATSTTNAASCATALPGAGPASLGAGFSDLRLPANSVSAAPVQVGGGGAGQFTIYQLQVCTSNSSPAAITTFFAGLTSIGWLHSNTFPANGSFQSNCPDVYCWAKDVRYVSLAQPTSDRGNGIERYHLMLASAPPAPKCASTFSPGYYYKIPDPHYIATQIYANVPLPPLSRIVANDAAGGQRGYDICSAGTIASITAFMTTNLAKQGWINTGSGIWTKSGYSLTVRVNAATDWLIGWHDPDFH